MFRIFLFVLCLQFETAAAPVSINAALHTQDLRIRMGGLILLPVSLSNASPSIVQGALVANVFIRGESLGSVRSSVIVLQPGGRDLILRLPPVAEAQEGDAVTIALNFVLDDDTSLALGTHSLGSVLGTNDVVLAVVRTERKLSEIDVRRERSIRVSALRPSNYPTWRDIGTHSVPLRVEDLPIHPLDWCAYDGVYLDAAAFRAMSEKQLLALARWLEAGGGAFILAEGPLESRHSEFLDRLGAPSNIDFGLDANRLVLAQGMPFNSMRLQSGLGCAVVRGSPSEDEKLFDSIDWHNSVAFFWRLNAAQRRSVERTGHWLPDTDAAPADPSSAFWEWLNTSAIGYDVLTPDTPRALPVGLVILLLASLLFLAGPADWWLLGWLRKRRWTWIVFPLLCFSFALGANLLAGRYLGRISHSGLVRIVDIGPGNRVIREWRLDLLMPSKDQEWMLDARDGVVSQVDNSNIPAQLAANGNSIQDTFLLHEYSPARNSETISEWKTASHLNVRQNLRQWSPSRMVSVTFPDREDDSGLDWIPLAKACRQHTREAGDPSLAFATPGWSIIFSDGGSTDKFHFINGVRPQGESGWDSHPAPQDPAPGPTRINATSAAILLNGSMPLERQSMFESRAPTLSGFFATSGAPPHPFTALAWREGKHELHIYRRTYSSAEMSSFSH